MLKKIILTLSVLSYPLITLADQLSLNEDAPKTYIVEKGDTLWDISSVFLEQPWLWPKLWKLNPDVNNPHLIYPGDVLKLTQDENGDPVLVVAKDNDADKTVTPLAEVEEVKEKPSYKWSPKIRQENKNNSAVSLLPLETIAPYLRYDHFFTADELAELPHIIGSDEGYRMTIDGFKVYVNRDVDLAKTYAIYDQGEELFDPETEESLGYYVNLVGTAQAIRTGNMADNEPSTLKVTSAKREIHSGDYVVPVHEGQLLPSVFTMKAADETIQGAIIKAASDGREFGKLEVVMLNKGTEHNVSLGDVMGIKRPSPAVLKTGKGPVYQIEAPRWNRLVSDEETEYKMPQEKLGELMVFKVYSKVSMALILRTEKPARLNDLITAP